MLFGRGPLAASKPVLSEKDQRRDLRFKDSFRGSIDYLGSSYLCLVDDISQHGLHLLSGAAVDVGDRMSVHLQPSPDAGLSCLIEVRHVTSDGLGAKIVYIGNADAYVLSDRVEKRRSALMVADAVRRGRARDID